MPRSFATFSVTLLLLTASGCYTRATVPSEALVMAAAMCGGNATAQPHPHVYRDNGGRTRYKPSPTSKHKGFVIDHKTQMRWNNDWVHVCYSGMDVRQVPELDLRRPDVGKAIGAGLGVGLSASLIVIPIILFSSI